MQIEDAIALIEAVSDDLVLVTRILPDGTLVIHWANAALCAASGYRLEELVGQDPDIFAGPQPDSDALAWLSDARAAGRRFRGTLPYHRKDGSHFWGDLTLSPYLDAQGGCEFWISLIRDITPDMELRDAFKDAKKEADTAQERLWSAIEALPDPFVLFDADDRMVMCNARYRDLFPEPVAVLKRGARFEDLLRENVYRGGVPEAVGREEEWIARRLAHFASPKGPVEQEVPGNRFVRILEVKSRTGDTVSLRIDITEFKRQQQAIERHARALSVAMERAQVAAQTDTLTGLANRRGLDVHLRSLSATDRAALPVAFLHIDLDRFKQINDMLGHAAGDHVLRQVSTILRRAVRQGDHVARVGGDEFAIVIEAEDAGDVARKIAEGIIEACAQPLWFEGHACHYGASIGIAVAEGGAQRANLMEDADIALYQAKQMGRSQAALYTPALRDAAEGDKLLADDLRLALDRDEIEPWFQPQVEILSGLVAGIESVARWVHPKRGTLAQEDFMEIAEDIGLAGAIDYRIVERTLAGSLALFDKGLCVPKVSLSASYRRLCRAGLTHGIDQFSPLPFSLAVELFDTIDFDGESERVDRVVDELRDRGAEIEIDDFGSGHASLTTLLRLRPERIKIDRRLVAAADMPGAEATAMLRAIGDMAQALGIGLTAQGVETRSQADALAAMGCDLMQGALVAPPMSLGALEQWLADNDGSAAARSA